jgi:hypothetical protein
MAESLSLLAASVVMPVTVESSFLLAVLAETPAVFQRSVLLIRKKIRKHVNSGSEITHVIAAQLVGTVTV